MKERNCRHCHSQVWAFEEEMVLTGIERIADLGSIVGQSDLIDPEAFLAARADDRNGNIHSIP